MPQSRTVVFAVPDCNALTFFHAVPQGTQGIMTEEHQKDEALRNCVVKELHFPRGLEGFEEHDFALLKFEAEASYVILRSKAKPETGLLAGDPRLFLPDYQIALDDEEQAVLHFSENAELIVVVPVNIHGGLPQQTSLNLTLPVVLNLSEGIGLQLHRPDAIPPRACLRYHRGCPALDPDEYQARQEQRRHHREQRERRAG